MKNNFTSSKMILSLIMFILPFSLFAQGMSKPIVFGQSITDTINPLSTVKGYTITLDSGDILYVRVASVDIYVKTKVEVRDPNGDIFASGKTTLNGALPFPIDLVKTALLDGKYTILVRNDGGITGPFCISVERFNSPTDAVFLNCFSNLISDINCNSSIRTFRYIVEANSRSQIVIASSNIFLLFKAWVSNPDGSIIVMDSTLTWNSSLTLDIKGQPKTQCFYVFVVKTPDLFTIENFSISHALLSGNCAAANIEASPSRNSYCAGDNITLTANTPLPNATYSWSGPKNFKSNKKTININNAMPGQSGTYTVIVDDPTNCSSFDSISIVINNRPTVSPSVASGKLILCAGDTFQLNLTTNAADPTYKWSGPNEYISNIQSPIIIVPDTSKSGIWYYDITVHDKAVNCDSTKTISIQINAKPPANITSPTNNVLCAGETLLLNVATDTAVKSFSWLGPKSFSSTSQNPNIPNVDISNQGNYIVTVIDTNGCHRKDTINVNVEEITLRATPRHDSIIASAFGGVRPYTYTIIPGGQTDTTGIFTNLKSGQYTIHVTDKNNCNDTLTINLVVGTVEPLTEWSLSISPNPSNGLFQIVRNENDKKDLFLSVFDGFGKKLTSFQMEGLSKTLDLNYLQDGVYMIRVSDGNKFGTTRVVIFK